MSVLRQKMVREMTLRGFRPKTQSAYLAAVKGLAGFYKKSPEHITIDEIKDYILFLSEKKALSFSTSNVVVSALKFLYNTVLDQKEISLQIPRKKKPKHLPHVLSREEVARIIDSAKNLRNRLLLMATYSGGLRVSEVVRLKPEHILASRMQILVVEGKGMKDRYTLLSEQFLEELRFYFKAFRPKGYLFSGNKPYAPMSTSTVQRIYNAVKKRAGIRHGRGIHDLRHSFATHLMESGYDIRRIQLLLGHRCLSSTMIYLHVTQSGMAQIKSPLDTLTLAPGHIEEKESENEVLS